MELSKSHMSLLPLKSQEEKASTKKSDVNNQLATKNSGSPSYADYENYFYI